MFYRSYKEIDNQSSNKEKHRIKCQIKKKSSDAPYDLQCAKINNLYGRTGQRRTFQRCAINKQPGLEQNGPWRNPMQPKPTIDIIKNFLFQSNYLYRLILYINILFTSVKSKRVRMLQCMRHLPADEAAPAGIFLIAPPKPPLCGKTVQTICGYDIRIGNRSISVIRSKLQGKAPSCPPMSS